MLPEQHIEQPPSPPELRWNTVRGITAKGQLGQALRTARRERNMTQADLSELCGVSRTQISRIESGRANPRVSTISRMLRSLTCSLTLVIEDNDGFDLHEYVESFGNAQQS